MSTLQIVATWESLCIPLAIINHGFILAYSWREYPSLQCEERVTELKCRMIQFNIIALLIPYTLIITFLTGMCKHGMMFRFPKL